VKLQLLRSGARIKIKASSFFGYKCPRCNSKVTVAAVVGGDKLFCPNCNTEMIPDREGVASAANAYCSKCNAMYGLVTSSTCPQCGGKLT
jgi:hypothetical protein